MLSEQLQQAESKMSSVESDNLMAFKSKFNEGLCFCTANNDQLEFKPEGPFFLIKKNMASQFRYYLIKQIEIFSDETYMIKLSCWNSPCNTKYKILISQNSIIFERFNGQKELSFWRVLTFNYFKDLNMFNRSLAPSNQFPFVKEFQNTITEITV